MTNFDDSNSCVSGPMTDDYCTKTKKSHAFLMDKILTEYADQTYEITRLRRNGVHTARELVSARMLAELEATGDAMRFVNGKGQIGWKATPSLRQHLIDLQLDAEADLEDF